MFFLIVYICEGSDKSRKNVYYVFWNINYFFFRFDYIYKVYFIIVICGKVNRIIFFLYNVF